MNFYIDCGIAEILGFFPARFRIYMPNMMRCRLGLVTVAALSCFSVVTAKAAENASVSEERAMKKMLSAAADEKPGRQPKLAQNLSESEDDFSDIPPVLVTGEEIRPVPDPLEGFNRTVFRFNETVDEVVLEPVAKGYRKVMPEWGRERVSHFVGNLNTPIIFVNSALQGDVNNMFTAFWRFVLNSTIGIGGAFDQATEWGLPERREDFDQTLGFYGLGTGPYIVWPLLGPSTLRGTFGMVGDALASPSTYVSWPVAVSTRAAEMIDTREKLIEPIDDMRRDSFDPYSTVKSAYSQRRAKMIENYNKLDQNSPVR